MWTVIHFEDAGPGRTRLRIIGVGYGDDDESRKLQAFFDKGNDYTIKKLQAKFDRQGETAHRPCSLIRVGGRKAVYSPCFLGGPGLPSCSFKMVATAFSSVPRTNRSGMADHAVCVDHVDVGFRGVPGGADRSGPGAPDAPVFGLTLPVGIPPESDRQAALLDSFPVPVAIGMRRRPAGPPACPR